MLTNLLGWITLQHVWLVIGFVAQGLFASRFFVQWIASEKAKSSVVPVSFWYLSLVGSLMLLGYAIHKRDPVFILGQSTGLLIYVRNLFLIRGSRAGVRPAAAD